MGSWGQFGLQEGASVIIELLNYFHDYILVILLLILSFVTYIFLYVSFSSRLDSYRVDSHLLETIWTVLPIVILFFMAFPSLYLLYLIEEVSSPALTVKVVAHQWYWEYEFSGAWFSGSFDSYMIHESASPLYYTLDVDNRLVLPVSASVQFLVTSADVLHSWTVPSLGVKTDAIPGRLNYAITRSITPGVFFGQCREICGSNHSFMPIVVEFILTDNFISYINNLSAAGSL